MFIEIPILRDVISGSTHVYRNHLYDSVDRLHFYVTVMILTFCALLTGAKQHFGNPIDCMLPKEIDDIGSWSKYVHSYCLMYGTYRYNYTSTSYNFPGHGKETSVTYYQWVPFFFAFQVFCFVLPHWIWTWMQKLLYLDMAMIVDYTHDLLTEKNSSNHSSKLSKLIGYAYDHFKYRRLHKIGYFAFLFLHPAFACILYISTKILFILNAIFQLKLVSIFLGFDSWGWGLDMIIKFIKDRSQGQSAFDYYYEQPQGPLATPMTEFSQFKNFPILVACDYRTLPSLSGFQNNTAQCIIPMNIVNEKLFIGIWIWLVVLIGISVLGTIGWIIKLSDKRYNESAIFQLLKNHEPSINSVDSIRKGARGVIHRTNPDYRYDFVHRFLGADGILLIHFMNAKCGTLKTQEVVDGLFVKFMNDFEKPVTKPVLTKKGEKTDYSEVNFGI